MGTTKTVGLAEDFRSVLVSATRKAKHSRPSAVRRSSLYILDDIFDPRVAGIASRALDRIAFPLMRPMTVKIARASITAMRKNYSEKLEKTMRFFSLDLNSPQARAYRAFEATSLLEVMRSEELRHFAETISGLELKSEVDCQVLCYEEGDYSGPHNDHHPEIASAKNGYVDVHILLPNEAVDSQLLVFEEHGLLTGCIDVGRTTGIAVYKLPFWHYTTPLQVKLGSRRRARRWLLLSSYDIKR